MKGSEGVTLRHQISKSGISLAIKSGLCRSPSAILVLTKSLTYSWIADPLRKIANQTRN